MFVRNLILYAAFCLSVHAEAQSFVDSAGLRAEAIKAYTQYKSEYNEFENRHGHFIQTPNVKMHYLTWGDPGHKPILWTHGTNGNAYEMYDIADTLAAAGYYVVAIDFYGHGQTPIPQKEVSLYHVADDIRYLMDALKIKKAIVGGFSRGGSISTAFYDAYRDRVSALILEDGGSVAWDVNGHKKGIDSVRAEFEKGYAGRKPPRMYESEQEMFVRVYMNRKNEPGFKKTGMFVLSAIKHDTDRKWRFNPGVNDLVCETTAEQLFKAVFMPFAADHLFGASTHLLCPAIIYRNLDVPMLIFDPVSENDVFDFEEENNKLQKSHPNLITHKVYQNCGHMVQAERPEDFTHDVLDFLKTVK